jgi:hypothetical protein
MLAVATPADKVALAADGSTIWLFRMQSWAAQVDELVQAGAYQNALGLLDSIDQALLPDKVPISCNSWIWKSDRHDRHSERYWFAS